MVEEFELPSFWSIVRTKEASMEFRKCTCFSSVQNAVASLAGTCAIAVGGGTDAAVALVVSSGIPRRRVRLF